MNGLRGRVRLQVDGGLRTGRDVVVARAARRRGVRLLDGAAGRRGLRDDARLPPQHVPRRHRDAGSRAAPALHRHARARRPLLPVRRRAGARADGAASACARFDDLVGRTDLLRPPRVDQWPWLRDLDLVAAPRAGRGPAPAPRAVRVRAAGPRPRPAPSTTTSSRPPRRRSSRASRSRIELHVRNTDRSLGAMLAGEIARRDPRGLPDGTIHLRARAARAGRASAPGRRRG